MLRVFLFFFLLFIIQLVHGQSSVDAVVLKDGRQLQGTITRHVPQVSLTLIAADGTPVEIPWVQIDRVVKLQQPAPQPADTAKSERQLLAQIELGYAVALNRTSGNFLKVGISGVRPLSQHVSLQFGTALHVYDLSANALLSIKSGCLVTLPFRKLKPVLGLSGGYSMFVFERFRGAGVCLNPSLGIRFFGFGKVSVNLSAGYELQWFNRSEPGRNSAGGYIIQKASHLESGVSLGFVLVY